MKKRFIAVIALLASVLAATPAGAETEDVTIATEIDGLGGVAVDADGNLWLTDNGSGLVYKVEADGTLTSFDYGLSGPYGAAFDAAGNMYVVDAGHGRVVKIDSSGTVTAIAGAGAGVDTLSDPYGIAIDGDSNVYFSDAGSDRVMKIDTGGIITTFASTDAGTPANNLDRPLGLAFDSTGNLYVADSVNDRVLMVDAGGAITVVDTGTGTDELDDPHGVAIDADGILYIADTQNNRVQKVVPGPTISTVVISAEHTVNEPFGVAVSAGGDVYIVQRPNVLITFDPTDPTVVITNPGEQRVADSAVYSFECGDTTSITSCVGTIGGETVSSGDAVDTTSRGKKTLTVVGTDGDGNTRSRSVSYMVYAQRELIGDYAGITGSSASIARLYMATFTRQPEAGGFEYWEGRFTDGMTLQQMADFFVVGEEFVALYGNSSNSYFVDLMYTNVLLRNAEQSGHDFWLGELEKGMTRSRMLLMFSDAPEFKEKTYTA